MLLIVSILKGDEITMVDVYVALIIRKRRTIEQVPQNLRAQVLADLNALGLDGNGKPIMV